MRTGVRLIFSIFFCCGAVLLSAQRVLYSPFVGTRPATRFEVIGKTGSYYWIQKSKTKFTYHKTAEPWLNDKDLTFGVYDERMNLLKEIPSFLSPDLVKEYLVPGDDYFDQLVLRPANNMILVFLARYTQDGEPDNKEDTVAEFPAGLKCGDFLLVRSQDKSKLLLLGFETVPDSPSVLHAFLFDKNWKLICQADYSDRNASKPLVQYDLVEYPLEDFNSASIKLSNDGECVMILSSGFNHNYILAHFGSGGKDFFYKEIKLPPGALVEDAGIYFDNGKQEGFAGILSRGRTTSVKNVRLVHYSLTSFAINFDTSYAFATLPANRGTDHNIYEEYFMTVPGKGFLFLKEYGRNFSPENDYDGSPGGGRQTEVAESSVNTLIPPSFTKDEYSRYDNLAGTRSNFDRGDLALYYFPAKRNDTCWSGIISKEQVTELGTSYLSYVFVPRQDKLFFLYNSIYRTSSQFSSATVLDPKGNPISEGVEYWQIRNTLVFQKARQISENELAIPYERNMRNGFAIIRL